jgi:hypothetical protein
MEQSQKQGRQSGKLRIGDDWNAITISARSQQSPLKAVAELVENSIDAHAANNFPGISPDRLLERMVGLSLYTEEHLK